MPIDDLSQTYVSLTQRLSLFKQTLAFAVPAGLGNFFFLGVSFTLAGQQAFRIVSASGVVNATAVPAVAGTVINDMYLLVSNSAFPAVNVVTAPSVSTLGIPFGSDGVAVQMDPTPLFFWNDFLGQGGLTGTVNIQLIGDVSTTAGDTIGMTLSALVEIYQVSTGNFFPIGKEALGYKP